MRYFPLFFVVAICGLLSVAYAEDAATFVVEDGAAPWSDRVGQWELADIPASIKGKDPIPQQNCSARSLTIAGKPASITIGIAESDMDSFKKLFPTAKETGDKFTIRRPKETSGIGYVVMTLASPPELISGGDTPFGAGLVVLKIEAAKP